MRRATRPSTQSSSQRDGREQRPGSPPAIGRVNASATSAATPPTSVARARVTRSAGPSRARPLRASAVTSQTVADQAAGEPDGPARRRRARRSRRGRRAAATSTSRPDQPAAALNHRHLTSVDWGYRQRRRRRRPGSPGPVSDTQLNQQGSGMTVSGVRRARSGCAHPGSARSARSPLPEPGPDEVLRPHAALGRQPRAPRRWCSAAGCRPASTPRCARRSRRASSPGR